MCCKYVPSRYRPIRMWRVSLGIDGLSLLREHGIPLTSLADSEARVSARAAARLLEASAQRSGVDSFGIRMAECRSFASIGPLALLLQHLQSVGAAIECLARLQRWLSDVVQVGCESQGENALIRFEIAPQINSAQGADLQVALGYLVLIGVSQGGWRPDVVHLTRQLPLDVAHFSRYFSAPIEFNNSFNGFSCSAADLQRPLPLADAAMASNARQLLDVSELGASTGSIVDHTRQSISLLLPSGRATVGEVAANLGKNARSLQRQLAASGTTFGILLKDVRRHLVVRHLSASSKSISEISGDLGYTNVSSFSRWFASEFRQSALDWRKGRGVAERPPAIWKV